MKNYIKYLACLMIIFGSAATQKNTDFSGKLLLKIDGETHVYEKMSRTDSRLSFQDKGIAIYIVNSQGEGTIAQITLLSNKIYDSKSHSYELGGKENKPKTMMDIYNKDSSKKKNILNFKFRRIDKMEKEEYLELSKGTVKLEYDDQSGYVKLDFEGEDKNGISLSGFLELKNPYLMDRRN